MGSLAHPSLLVQRHYTVSSLLPAVDGSKQCVWIWEGLSSLLLLGSLAPTLTAHKERGSGVFPLPPSNLESGSSRSRQL